MRQCYARRLRWYWLLISIVVLVAAVGIRKWQRVEDPYDAKAYALADPYVFSIPRWEIKALSSEVSERVRVRKVDPAALSSRQLVLDYMEVARRIGSLEWEIERIVAESETQEEARSRIAPLQHEVNQLRALQEARRPVVERILEGQITHILEAEDLGWLGQPLPPVAFQFTEPPYYLILSPRDRIELRLGIHLQPRLSLETREALETRAEAELPNTSALVEGIGGFSTWPTMVIDRADVRWVLSTIAHEWVHTYLIAYPLGRKYYDSPDMSAINETVADIVGNEIGQKALRQFYPETVPPTPTPTPAVPSQL